MYRSGFLAALLLANAAAQDAIVQPSAQQVKALYIPHACEPNAEIALCGTGTAWKTDDTDGQKRCVVSTCAETCEQPTAADVSTRYQAAGQCGQGAGTYIELCGPETNWDVNSCVAVVNGCTLSSSLPNGFEGDTAGTNNNACVPDAALDAETSCDIKASAGYTADAGTTAYECTGTGLAGPTATATGCAENYYQASGTTAADGVCTACPGGGTLDAAGFTAADQDSCALFIGVGGVTVFDETAVGNTYPTAAEEDVYAPSTQTLEDGNGAGWGAAITTNFNGAASVINYGDVSTSSGNNPQTTTYNGPTVYAGMTRDAYIGSAGIIHANGNGYRIRVNNVNQAAHDDNGGDVNFKAVFMFDALYSGGSNYGFNAGSELTATVATPNNMNVRASLATYRAMVKADGEYYAGTLETIDLSLLSGPNSATHTFVENGATATWTLMDNMESADNRLQSATTTLYWDEDGNAVGEEVGPQNLAVDGTTTVLGSELTGITQVGFLLETSSRVQSGGYNYGVRAFSATLVDGVLQEYGAVACCA